MDSPIVFLHGLLVNGSLWEDVVALLPGRECVVLELPLGAHAVPAADRSTVTPAGVADLVAQELARRELRNVTIVANDTGGAIAQLLVTRHPERIAKLVLTPSDALEVFPPAVFKPLFLAGRSRVTLSAFVQSLRLPFARRLPIAYGWLTKRARDETLAGWSAALLRGGEPLADAAHFFRHVDPGVLLDAAPRLRACAGEGIIAGPPEDRCFPIALGRRLAAQFQHATLVEIEDSYSFVPLDQPAA